MYNNNIFMTCGNHLIDLKILSENIPKNVFKNYLMSLVSGKEYCLFQGSGDITGGCKCRLDGVICHPNCNNCH